MLGNIQCEPEDSRIELNLNNIYWEKYKYFKGPVK